MRKERQTICWTCSKACGGCSWSGFEQNTPVPGWDATPSMLKVNGGYVETYTVHACPEYEPEKRDRRKN